MSRTIGAPLTFGFIGKTSEGRDIPYVIASRPQVRTPAQARALGRPIVHGLHLMALTALGAAPLSEQLKDSMVAMLEQRNIECGLSPAEARAQAQRALEALDEISKAEANAEYGKWKGWYRGDWLTGIGRTRELVQIFAKQLEDASSPMPPPIYWTGWEAYYHIMHYEGGRTADVN